MNIKHSPLLTLGISAGFSAMLTHTAMAADIETLVGQVQDFAGPNVTLVIDTSGSMNSEVFLDSETHPYDPMIDYTGPFDIHESFGIPKQLFYSLTPNNSINYLDENDVNSNQWVKPDNFFCAEGQSLLLSNGIYTDQFAQFRRQADSALWDFPVPADGSANGGENLITECQADFGIHGDGSGAGSYPINFNQLPVPSTNIFPWSDLANDPSVIVWEETGSRYTFFTPNYLNWIYERKLNNDPVVLTRLEIVQSEAKKLIQTLKLQSLANNDGLRLGLMRFSADGSGGLVLSPTTDVIANDAVLAQQIADLTASGSTPLAETMFEVYRYYTGGAPRFGGTTSVGTSIDSSTGNYISPIEAACQKNYVILLTDGLPNADFQADLDIEAITGECTGNCLDEMTNFMSTNDMAPTSEFSGDQIVETFIIGFFADFPLLEDATTGQIDTDGDDEPDTPGYFLANNANQLRDAFEDIFGPDGIDANLSTFTAPAVSVNSLNRLTNRDTLYFTLYEPSPSGEPHWNGNLKAYKIGRASGSSVIEILGSDGLPAVDNDTGVFLDSAMSFWGTGQDGPNVAEGGVASRLSAQRNIFSNLTENSNLTADGNRISRDNSDAIGAIPGMPQGNELLELIDFTSGLNSEGGARRILGDPLHSQPLVINFGGGDDDLLLLFGTNDGYLHAIDPTQDLGSTNDLEHFAFIPKELLPEQPGLKANNPSPFAIANKTYGMDGPITAWIEGGSGSFDDLVVESGDTLRVYAGMRRGGRSYYAFDFSDRDAPKLEFTIDSSQADYSNLGQTWSAASYAKIKLNDVEKDVLIFGGGYDTNQDSSNSADSMGNSVYIADAKTGALIWSAGGVGSGATLELDAMTHSIPSDVRIIDSNRDGFIDRMYVGDMGAQVWRFDINLAPDTPDEAITGGRIADLGGEGSTNERRFYSAPSVSSYVENGRRFLAVSLGSGYRAHPLDSQIEDNFYVLRDDFVYAPALNPTGVPEYGDANADLLTTEPELIALTINGIESGTSTIGPGSFGRGWYLELSQGRGEKSLSSAITAEGRIFFTTYSPDSPSLTCSPVAATGAGRLYGIDILTGLPALFDDPDTGEIIASALLGPTGIPPQPQVVFVAPPCEGCGPDDDPDTDEDENSELTSETATQCLVVGNICYDVDIAARAKRTYWVEF